MLIRSLIAALSLSASVAYCASEPAVVPSVDLARYMGTWYEISAMPNRMQKGCTDTVVHYKLRPDGDFDLLNTCWKGDAYKPYQGRGKVVDPKTKAKLYIKFFLFLGTPYWIIDLDPDYRWAAVGVPDRDQLWIISRTPVMEDSVYEGILARAKANGFDVGRLVRSRHTGKKAPAAP
jgi:apolipoprotein D and lipocalin family protein